MHITIEIILYQIIKFNLFNKFDKISNFKTNNLKFTLKLKKINKIEKISLYEKLYI